MNCHICSNDNPQGSKFCTNCGQRLTEPAGPPPKRMFGIFQPGGYGDGFFTLFSFQPSAERMLEWANCPASVTLSTPDHEWYMGEVSQTDLHPQDAASTISQRFQVHSWRRLNWNGAAWEIGEPETTRPDTIGLSNLERGLA